MRVWSFLDVPQPEAAVGPARRQHLTVLIKGQCVDHLAVTSQLLEQAAGTQVPHTNTTILSWRGTNTIIIMNEAGHIGTSLNQIR